jgi:hypothetical protein
MPLNAQQLGAIATNALLTGQQADTAFLTTQISNREDYTKLSSLAGLQGGMASTAQQLQTLAADYGYKWTPAQIAERAQNILDGTQTLDTYQNNLKTWAKSAFPGLAKQIDAGQTIKDLADPYMQSMSSLLEVDPGTLTTYTPLIRKALQGSIDQKTGDASPTPLWQFEQQVRSDPRWRYTQNATDSMASMLAKIGQDFGFGF